MTPSPIIAAFKKLLDDLWNSGKTPRLYIDARHEDVVFFEDLKKRYDHGLIIDLKANDPINIEYTVRDFRADLTSGGRLIRAIFPWQRIYAVGPNDSRDAMQIGVLPDETNGPGGPRCLVVPPLEEKKAGFPLGKVIDIHSRDTPVHTKRPNPNRDKFKLIPGGKK